MAALPASASLLRLSFIEIKEERGQQRLRNCEGVRAVEASGGWLTNLLFIIQMATFILEFSYLVFFGGFFCIVVLESARGAKKATSESVSPTCVSSRITALSFVALQRICCSKSY